MVNFVLFGAGRIGVMHAANIAAHAEASLAYVYDVDRLAAERVAAKYGAKAVDSVEAALADKSVDAALIASSTNTHIDLITASALAGKAILCEKPLDLDIGRVEHCRKALAGVDARIQVGFNRRYDPSHRSVAEAVQNGGIGNLELLIVTSRDPGLSSLAYLKVSGGIFRDMTIHDFDLARFVLAGDEIVEVSAMGSVMVDKAVGELGEVDTAMVTMKALSGALIHINNSRRSVYGYDQRLEAFGSKGMARSENLRSTTLLRSDEKGTDIKQPLLNFFIERYTQAYLEELDEFIGAVTNQKQPQVGFEDGRRALILANAAWDSLRSGKVIRPSYA